MEGAGVKLQRTFGLSAHFCFRSLIDGDQCRVG